MKKLLFVFVLAVAISGCAANKKEVRDTGNHCPVAVIEVTKNF